MLAEFIYSFKFPQYSENRTLKVNKLEHNTVHRGQTFASVPAVINLSEVPVCT